VKSDKAQIILHPIRMRIIQTLIGGVQLTAQQMAEVLSDVPQASLYRHLNKLTKAGIVSVVAENPVRGAVEKVYALPEQAANLSGEDLANASREEHMQYFITFVASLLGDFSRYLQAETIDLESDGVGYRQVALYLNDEEFQEFISDLSAVVKPLLANRPRSDRRRRLFSTIVMPGVEVAPNPNPSNIEPH
jgi:DNA-binding transcriptional ArsR family regulator